MAPQLQSIPPYIDYLTQSVEVVSTSKISFLGAKKILDCLPNTHMVEVENETVTFSVKTDNSSYLTYSTFTKEQQDLIHSKPTLHTFKLH